MTFFKSFDDEVKGESARGIAIAGGSGLDHQLKNLLKSNLLHSAKDDKLFGVKQPLHDYSAKCAMAHALGLISDNEKRELEFVGKIRNKLGHEIGSGSFDVEPVRSWCMELRLCEVLYTPKTVPVPRGVGTVYPHGYDEDGYPLLSKEDLFLPNPRDAKSRFIASINVMMIVLATRIFNTMDTKVESPPEFTSPVDVRKPILSALEHQLDRHAKLKQSSMDLKARVLEVGPRVAEAGLEPIDVADVENAIIEQDQANRFLVAMLQMGRFMEETVRRARARYADQANDAS